MSATARSTSLHWVVGASSGIGAMLAERLARRGHPVVASARRAQALDELAARQPGITALSVDVTDGRAMQAALADIETRLGPVHTAVLNAGDYAPMNSAALDVALMRRIYEVNYFGVVNALDALLPRMLERGHGRIAINASVAGYRGLPMAGAYGPTKAALINLAEVLRVELEPRGLTVQVINPGFVRTPLTAQNRFHMPGLIDADEASRRIVEGLATRRFEITFPRRFTWVMKALRCVPYALYFPLVRRATQR